MARQVIDLMPPIDEHVGDGTPDPALFAPGRAKKARKSRHFAEKKGDISINSLLDILSVILVFLLKSYSASSIVLKPAKDLHPPFSQSTLAPEESTAVTVTVNHILVDDKPCVNLENGKVMSRDQSQGGMLIQPLFEELQQAVDHQKRISQRNSKAEFKGIMTIIGDRYVKSTLILQIMYTAGLSEFSKFKFMLVKTERG
jgi:biopolymer transport protein ExbD